MHIKNLNNFFKSKSYSLQTTTTHIQKTIVSACADVRIDDDGWKLNGCTKSNQPHTSGDVLDVDLSGLFILLSFLYSYKGNWVKKHTIIIMYFEHHKMFAKNWYK